jgi:Flp pilus assembly protein TadD
VPFGRIAREKFPYFALAAAGAMVSYYAQAANAFITPLAKAPLAERPSIVAFGLWFYVTRTAIPIWLSPLHELPVRPNPLAARFLLSALGVGLLTATVVALRRRWPAGLAAWLYYVIVLSPVVGFVHSGFQLAHDRYSYLSCMSWAVLVGGAAGAVARARETGVLQPVLGRLAAAVVLAWMLSLGALSWWQTEMWRDTDTLWRSAIESEPDCTICQNNLGVSMLKQGQGAEAKARFERVLAVHPFSDKTHRNLGMAQDSIGDHQAAVETFTALLAQTPSDLEVRNNLGIALANLHRYREAIMHFQIALRVKPDDVRILNNVGFALAEIGDREASLAHVRRAVTLQPDDPALRFRFGVLCLRFGDIDTAREQYEALRTLDARLASILGPGLLTEW